MISFRDCLYYAEALYDDAQSKIEMKSNRANAYIIGCILSSWMSVESFINSMMNDFTHLPDGTFSIHERGFLEEKQVKFETRGNTARTFQLSNQKEYKRLEDKIMFLIAKFGKSKQILKGDNLWQRFEKVKEKRNILTHPRKNGNLELDLNDAKEAIDVAKQIIEFVSNEVWGRKIEW